MPNGQKITQLVYENLRKPPQSALHYSTVLNKIAEVVRKKKLDLSLADQNALLTVSHWFTPTGNDFAVNGLGGIANILLPVRVEVRSISSTEETGREVPLVNYDVLNTSEVGAAAFYGSPLRMSFRGTSDAVTVNEYRIAYEPDFTDDIQLNKTVQLPNYFTDMVAGEATYLLIALVIDDSPAWAGYLKLYLPILETNLADWRRSWAEYVRKFKGKAQIPKRTFMQNRRARIVNRPIYLNEVE